MQICYPSTRILNKSTPKLLHIRCITTIVAMVQIDSILAQRMDECMCENVCLPFSQLCYSVCIILIKTYHENLHINYSQFTYGCHKICSKLESQLRENIYTFMSSEREPLNLNNRQQEDINSHNNNNKHTHTEKRKKMPSHN